MVGILRSWLADYKNRFAPALLFKILTNDIRRLPKTEELCDVEELSAQLKTALLVLERVFPSKNFSLPTDGRESEEVSRILLQHLGFRLSRKESSVAGRGVFVEQGNLRRGQLACVYPGTIYRVGDPLLLQSLGNQFVLTCRDGVSVDGNDRRLSRIVHRSCARRDFPAPYTSDLTWLGQEPFSFLNLGHYVNNATHDGQHNVQYMEFDVQDWPLSLRKFLPYAVFNPSATAIPLRVVCVVAIRDISIEAHLIDKNLGERFQPEATADLPVGSDAFFASQPPVNTLPIHSGTVVNLRLNSHGEPSVSAFSGDVTAIWVAEETLAGVCRRMTTPSNIQIYCDVDPMRFFPSSSKSTSQTDPRPAVSMKLEPPFAEFIELGGASKHAMINDGMCRVVFKVKCSNNSLFKVSPVYAFLDPGASTELQILRQQGISKHDKLIILLKEAKRSDKDPRKAFQAEATTVKKVLPLIARQVEER
ncbi:unnamed protein product [Caenorhabditis auriculariae]|uniref:Major sperm protein n=1 Tax=Caenorhabditis auriculariae TaxID=2777116 RepID=A0A8S1GYH7_9PELO|nr:unnamed protein product [Caenorhabditis auriculariae]